MQEIDQRSKNALVIKCNCGGYHFVEFDYWVDEDSKDFWVSIIDTPGDLWYRIKTAFKFIFTNSSLNWMEVGLTENDLDKVIKKINEYKAIR